MRFLVVLTLCLLPIDILLARNVRIVVVDEELGMPLEGAMVRSFDGSEYECDADGAVMIQAPNDRQSVILAAYPGYESGRLVIPRTGESFTLSLRSGGGLFENSELVIEAERPGGTGESGKSTSIAGEDLVNTAEIGILEDVMTSIKLLPGVINGGHFDNTPSIRGGNPRDMMSVFDGFYLSNPFHWFGIVSIFDPRMVDNVKLSHGVFSVRYGQTISGLLEVSSRIVSKAEIELEAGISMSSANLDLSFPFAGKGGIMLMGKASWYDLAAAMAKPFIPVARVVKSGPYIRDAAVSVNYLFTPRLQWKATGFFGADGMDIAYDFDLENGGVKAEYAMPLDNKQGFFITDLNAVLSAKTVLRAMAGTGFTKNKDDDTTKFLDRIDREESIDGSSSIQGRLDFDWDIGWGVLASFGAEEVYTRYNRTRKHNGYEDISAFPPIARHYNEVYENASLSSSAYMLAEYSSPRKRISTEIGVRMDHLYMMMNHTDSGTNTNEKGARSTAPLFNPRINAEFTILKDANFIESLSVSLGTGLFSSLPDDPATISLREARDFGIRLDRSWTTVTGLNFAFLSYHLNVEGYYKRLSDVHIRNISFDGRADIWGLDLMLKKDAGRYWDGWITYSFNYARYRDTPNGIYYFPEFHRFHTFSLIMNLKPVRRFNIALKFSYSSPQMQDKTSGNKVSGRADPDPPSLDVKFSWLTFNKKGKAHGEIYFAVENILFFLNMNSPSINDIQGNSAAQTASRFLMPFPIPSFGFKWNY
jgi:hypothetical protein